MRQRVRKSSQGISNVHEKVLMISLSKLEKLIFYLFIFCIPFQTRLILAKWPVLRSFSEGGVLLPNVSFNEWTSAFLYLTDLFILALLALWLLRVIKNSHHLQSLTAVRDCRWVKFCKNNFVLLGFIVISALSITQSNFKQISWYQFLKLVEFAALYFYVRANRDKVFNIFGICWAIFLSGVFQAIIAIAQYINQASLGLRWLGESSLHLPGEGIASFYSGSQLTLRPYGTLPHPNVLAVFLLVALIACAILYFLNKTNLASYSDRHTVQGSKKDIFLLIGFATMLYAFFLTYSRTVIAIALLVLVIFLTVSWFNKNWRKQLLQYKKQLVMLVSVSVVVVVLFLALNYQEVVARVFFSKDDEAVTMRLFYNRVAGQDFLDRTWLGSGIGTFVSNMMVTLKHAPANIFQPVHNIYLLILAETGLLGLAFWGLFIKSTIRSYIAKYSFSDIKNIILPMILWSFLLISLFDHFFWTLQQGHLLLWLAIALLA